MQKLIAAALIISCAACADTGTETGAVTSKQDIHASSFIYDPAAKPIIVSGGNFVYDASAPALHASSFVVQNNQ